MVVRCVLMAQRRTLVTLDGSMPTPRLIRAALLPALALAIVTLATSRGHGWGSGKQTSSSLVAWAAAPSLWPKAAFGRQPSLWPNSGTSLRVELARSSGDRPRLPQRQTLYMPVLQHKDGWVGTYS
jgi:hypothetical protein